MALADFPEQKQVIDILQRSLERGRLAHGYLFSGSDLAELEAVAGALAKTINCQSPPRTGAGGAPVESCDHCDSCRRVANENHPDLSWVRPESKSRVILISQVRALMQTIYLKPTMARFKVGVVVAADRLTGEAANAFLKTLEEPPANSILILLSTDPQRMIETILSRCLRLHFAGESVRWREEHAGWFQSFGLLASEGKGGLLARYRLLGALMARLGAEKEAVEGNLRSLSPLERHEDIDPKLRDRWEEELAASVEAEYRRRRSELVLGVQFWLRDIWLRALRVDDTPATFPELDAATRAIAARISAREALENLDVLERTQRLLRTNIQEALALEVGLLKLKL